MLAIRHMKNLHLDGLAQLSHSMTSTLVSEGDMQETEVDRYKKD